MDNKERNSFLRNLIEIFNKNKLDDLEFKDGDLEIKLKKRTREEVYINNPTVQTMENTSLQNIAPNNIDKSIHNNLESSNPKVVDYSKHEGAVKSPTVGIIYTRPQPTDNTFISVGASVKKGDTLFLLEVMKVFNPIKAHKSGIIKEIFVKENSIVEYNEVLAIIE